MAVVEPRPSSSANAAYGSMLKVNGSSIAVPRMLIHAYRLMPCSPMSCCASLDLMLRNTNAKLEIMAAAKPAHAKFTSVALTTPTPATMGISDSQMPRPKRSPYSSVSARTETTGSAAFTICMKLMLLKLYDAHPATWPTRCSAVTGSSARSIGHVTWRRRGAA